MVNQQRSAIILFCFVFLIAFLASSCIYNAVSSEEPVEAAVTEIPTITEAPDTIEKTEPTPLPTPTEPAGNIVTVYNARQLLSNMVSNRHIRLVPGGDYDLASISLASSIFYGLDNLTLEGVGEIPVAVHTKNMESVVMSFSNCSNITFINLDLSHTAPVSPNNNCKGKVLAFYDNTADITIKNCILSGCGITGLYATNTTNLYCEDTIIRDCSMSIMDIDRLRSATFTRCTFKADNSQVIKLSQCRDTLFSDCLFTGEYWLPSVRIGDWSPYEEANRNLYAKTINMEKTEQGILIEKSVLARDDYADLCRQFKDNLSSCLPAYPFDIDISWEETLGSAALCMKTPVTFKNIQEEYQLCFDNIMLSMKDLPLPEAELFLEIGPIYAGYPNFNNLLERARNGEKISFWETDFINLGDLDAGLINPENNKYLSTQQACENLLQQLPLPVSTNDDEPFVNIADVVTGKTTLIYDDGRLFYLFKDFSYGAEENIGYDGFCIDAATGTLNKFHDEGYVEVSSADKVLIADIIGYLEKSGAVIAPNDWIKVQIYDNDVASVYFGARLYFQLKMTKTSEGTVFEPYKMKSQSEGDISSDIAELSNKNNPPVQQLNDEYDLKWTFSEEMMVHFILGKIGNTLLVYGHDGGISGYHSDEYLYGLDAETGKKIWSVYGGYLGIASVLSRKDGKVYAGIKAHDWDPPRLICLDVVTGAILWEKGLSRQSYSIMDYSLGEAVAFLLRSEEDSVLRVLDKANGQLVWEKRVHKNDRLLNYCHGAPGIVIRQEDGVKAFDWITGKELWSIPDKQAPEENLLLQNAGIMASLEDITNHNVQSKRWMAFEEDYKHVEMWSGKILDSIPRNNSKREIMPLNDDYLTILDYVKEDKISNKVKSFSLYSVPLKKELWSKNDDIIGAVLHQSELYYITGTKLKSVNLLTGVVNWSKPFSANLDEAPLEDNHFIQPIIADEKLLVSEQGILYAFNLENGERLYQVSDYSIKNFMAGGYKQYYCSMVVIDGRLYIGSGSGKLSCLEIEP